MDQCLRAKYFTDASKVAKVTVLMKSPDKTRSDISSYNGYCLFPVLGKVFERLLVYRLQEVVNNRLCA